MRYMGLDLGTKTLGIALSDRAGIIASSYGTIRFENGMYIHSLYKTCFQKESADKYFTVLQGKEWTGGDVFDDFC